MRSPCRYKKYGKQQQVKETYGHTRGVTLPYDKDSVKLGYAAREMFVKSFKKDYPGWGQFPPAIFGPSQLLRLLYPPPRKTMGVPL